MSEKEKLIDDIDAILPQTQCGLCEYAACRSYAAAMVNNEAPIDRCLPGGVETLLKLADALEQDPTPSITKLEEKTKPASIAFVREDECIGCTKCIQACPTDAIIGASKLMHTVITDACTGCELCLPPCPVDCIDMKIIAPLTPHEKKQKAQQWRSRYEKKQKRLSRHKAEQRRKHQEAKLVNTPKQTLDARKAAIRDSIERVRAKKGNSNGSN
ncbi:RnfABCDGE type electron transport complex subunit B [Coxiella burnetii]|uniref:RnfABCDGE type electron transport complex subunit B n=1 Tax=Coxiella burnetii TaxID=777 RepID=UPI00051F1B2D|nr:RnfABCDGE type electron transport complex subunit B [Coxiella burnetii]AIT62646.1 Electron transport complex protein RnfB [Coxiella burnetii str. Namibia]